MYTYKHMYTHIYIGTSVSQSQREHSDDDIDIYPVNKYCDRSRSEIFGLTENETNQFTTKAVCIYSCL
jgi:hypothetical protein